MIIAVVSMLLTIIVCGLVAVLSVAVVSQDPSSAKGLYYVLGLVGALVAVGLVYLVFWFFGVVPKLSMVLIGVVLGYLGCGRVVLVGLLAQKFGGVSQ